MKRRFAFELEFDKLLDIVAAHARTRLGRQLLHGRPVLPSPEETLQLSRLTREIGRLMEEKGSLPLAGVDEALPWLEAGHPPPADARDLLSLLGLARRVNAVRRQLHDAPPELAVLHDLGRELPDTSDLVRWASSRLGREGQVPDQASPELARLRRLMARLRQELVEQLDVIRRCNPEVVTDAPPTMRRDRYCLPVRAAARGQLPGLVLDSSGSGATAFLEPLSVVELNNQLVDTTAREGEEVRRILSEVAAAFADCREELAGAVDVLSQLDAAQARASFGQVVEGVIVDPDDGHELNLVKARHPLLDQRLHALRGELFGNLEQRNPAHLVVPLSFRLPEGVRTIVLSGPNAGGKTVVLKTIGLMVLMAHHGIPVPAAEGTTLPRVDHIWCHIGDEQNVAADLSTFSAAMATTAELLAQASERSLVLYDELGTGTDPLEGAALGCSVLEELTSRRSLTVAATHLAAVAMAASSTKGMDNAAMEYDEERQRPTYRLRLGRPGRSRGLEIAHAMGIPSVVVARARELLGGQHLELDRWLRRLEQVEGELHEERSELTRQAAQIHALRQRLGEEIECLEEERRKLPEALAAERERLRRRAKSQLDEALRTLDEATREHRPLGRRLRRRVRDQALDVPVASAEGEAAAVTEAAPGARVAILGGTGVLQEIRGSRALVRVAGKRLWVARDELQLLEPGQADQPATRVDLDIDEDVPGELVLLGMDSEEARDELVHFLDRALVAGRTSVRIVHGHGTGTLRRMVSETCRTHPAVRSFRHPPQHLGGTGATDVSLEVSDHG